MQEAHRLIQTKVLLSECFIAEAKLGSFLFECMDKHGTGLTLEETLTAKGFVSKIRQLLARIQDEQDTPPDKLPVYPIGGYPHLLRSPTRQAPLKNRR